MKEVIIMGNIMERYYSNDDYEYAHGYRGSVHICISMEGSAKVITETKFKEFAEIGRSQEIDKTLKVGDLIYLDEDNVNYPIENISTDLEGNTLYFIDKTVKIVDAKNIEETKIEAQKFYDDWKAKKEEFHLSEKKEEGNYKIKEVADKETSKMESLWKYIRGKK